MLRLAQEREQLSVINDQFGAPTGADLLADVTAHAIRHVQQHPEHLGLYHCAAGERLLGMLMRSMCWKQHASCSLHCR